MERRDLFLVASGHAFSELEGADKNLARVLDKSRQTINRMRNGQIETWVSRGLADVWDLETAGINSTALITPLQTTRRVARLKRHDEEALLEWFRRVNQKEQRINRILDEAQMAYLTVGRGMGALVQGFFRQAAVSLKAGSLAWELSARGVE